MSKLMRGVASVALCAGAVQLSAVAQEGQDGTKRLATVTVSAQKREQNLQDVPLSVTVVTGEDVEKAGTGTITDLQVTVPGLTVAEANRPATSTTIRIRGIGTNGNDGGLEGAVGFFLDGVYRSRSGMGLSDLVDIKSVQVLRGPQGTLFGKNTSAGALLVETKDPSYETEGEVSATFGNYDLQKYTGILNVPLIEDKLAVRLVGSHHKRDGFIEDSVTGADYNDRDRTSIAGKVLFEPTSNLSFLLKADYSKQDESCCQLVRLTNPSSSALVGLLSSLANGVGASYPTDPNPEARLTSINIKPVVDTEDKGISLTTEWAWGEVDVKSITSYRDFYNLTYNDVDFSGADIVRQGVTLDAQQFSQEFQFNGRFDGLFAGVDWLVGAYYADEEIFYHEKVSTGASVGPYFSALINSTVGALYPAVENGFGADATQDGQTFAIFTHNIIDFSERVHGAVGLRYTDETKDVVSNPFFNVGPTTLPFSGLGLPFSPHHPYDQTFTDDAVTGSVSLTYDWTDAINTYVSYSRGFKSGGFALGREAAGPVYLNNATCSDSGTIAFAAVPGIPDIYACDPKDPSFDSETADSYELGWRSILADGSLLLNVTAFYTEYSNLQLNQFDGLGFVISNAGSATTQGWELEGQWVTPVDGLTLSTNVSWIDAVFGDEVGSLASGEPAVGGQNVGGSPKWSGSLTANYERRLNDTLDFYAFGTYSYAGDQRSAIARLGTDGSPLITPGSDLINLGAGLQFQNGLEVSVYCRNCTDEFVEAERSSAVAQSNARETYLGNPREYGITVRKTF